MYRWFDSYSFASKNDKKQILRKWMARVWNATGRRYKLQRCIEKRSWRSKLASFFFPLFKFFFYQNVADAALTLLLYRLFIRRATSWVFLFFIFFWQSSRFCPQRIVAVAGLRWLLLFWPRASFNQKMLLLDNFPFFFIRRRERKRNKTWLEYRFRFFAFVCIRPITRPHRYLRLDNSTILPL
jgi:hypothetical protein